MSDSKSPESPQVIKPCQRCGYEGKLEVVSGAFWLEIECPGCKYIVSAFTPAGIIENWNKPVEK